jgi:DNA-3-methyladenine glycosylase II
MIGSSVKAGEKLTVPAVFPFRLDLTSWALRRRKNNIIDGWDGHRYARTAVFNNVPMKITVVQDTPSSEPELSILSRGEQEDADGAMAYARRLIQKTLRPDLNLRPFYALTENDEFIGPLVRRFAGVKPPRFPTIFEALVNAIACQQVSLDVGIILLNRLAEMFGKAFSGDGTPSYAFPGPEDLLDVPAEEIKKLGFSYQKGHAIRGLATAFVGKEISPDELEQMAGREVVEYLCTLRGIGRWSAEYVLLRGLGRLDTFPGDDIGAQNSLRQLFRLDRKPGYGEIKELTSRWHPYEGLVYFHLLLNKLYLSGVI